MWHIENIKTFENGRYMHDDQPDNTGVVYIGRGGRNLATSPLCNIAVYTSKKSMYVGVVHTDDPIGWFRKKLEAEMQRPTSSMYAEITRLAGLPDGILLCWCTPNACHGSVIAEYIERYRAG